ncbi:hypothetical protein FNH09_13510 [Streptomyces adustus]|uniref:Uncharacterized protein n=1 Tax=Streptomyces adustus TaxID=1609272 RepID=A0A5N8VAM1_9ACTN|nr:hypothetical protein [Streptomyces adustus]
MRRRSPRRRRPCARRSTRRRTRSAASRNTAPRATAVPDLGGGTRRPRCRGRRVPQPPQPPQPCAGPTDPHTRQPGSSRPA